MGNKIHLQTVVMVDMDPAVMVDTVDMDTVDTVDLGLMGILDMDMAYMVDMDKLDMEDMVRSPPTSTSLVAVTITTPKEMVFSDLTAMVWVTHI